MENDIVGLIGSLGFPIAMTVYLLFERGKTMKELIKVIQELKLLIAEKLN